MDSLLASYASSDEEEAAPRPPRPPPSLHSTITTTTASSLFSSLPRPTTTTSSLFSSLPPPKSGKAGKAGKPDPSSSNPNHTKKVVFLKPLWSSSGLGSDDEDDDGEKKAKAKEKEEKQAAQVSKSQTLSLPPPKHSFGLAPPPPSAGRRALVDTNTAAAATTATKPESASYGEKAASLGVVGVAASDCGYRSSGYTAEGSSDPHSDVGTDAFGGYGDHNNQEKVESTSYGEKVAALGVDGAAASDYGYYASDPYCNVGGDGYGGYPQYGSGWGDGAMAAPAPTSDFVVENARRVKGKRGRDEVPAEVVEVKQDELVKNGPREDQTRMTGIAFGPAYQPASSAKGKPSKLHKRKHQIGSLYFDMKQKEMELTERRARGLQTKAETQGKYGW